MHSSDELVTFIDNAENRMVLELDAEWAERRFMQQVVNEGGKPVGNVWTDSLLHHIGLDSSWYITREEYTGDTYIITIERMWV